MRIHCGEFTVILRPRESNRVREGIVSLPRSKPATLAAGGDVSFSGSVVSR